MKKEQQTICCSYLLWVKLPVRWPGRIIQWFRDLLIIAASDHDEAIGLTGALIDNQETRQKLQSFLKAMSTGIEELRIGKNTRRGWISNRVCYA